MKKKKLSINERLEKNGTKKKIEEYFFSNDDNRVATIAKKFKLTDYRVKLLLEDILNERVKK